MESLMRANHFAIFMALVVWGHCGGTFGQSPLDYDQCRDDEQDAGIRIIACSRLIADSTIPQDLHAEAYSSRGEAYENEENYSSAIADQTQALLLKPNYAEAYNLRAWAYFKSGKAEQGLADAEKAVSLQPQSAYALDTRAHIYEAMGKKEEAIADYRKSVSLNPDLRESKEALARLNAQQ
jgi:tetratricopeptide (TPR) repeat protein